MNMNQFTYYVLILLNIIFASITATSAAGCSLEFKTDFPDKESVLLRKSSTGYDLIEPSNDGIYLKANEQIAIACPGAKNTIDILNKNLTLAKCVSGQNLKIGTNNYLLNQLGCKNSVVGEFQVSEDSCGQNGVIKNLGHNIDGQFYTLIDVCYEDEDGGTFYADHLIYGSAIDYARSSQSRPSFKVGGLATGVAAEQSYKQTTQKSTFASLLGSVTLAEKYIYPNSYLAKGHLAPHADMIFVSSKFSTYFYINTVPQWQQINNGNWKSLETALRHVASSLGEDFEVLTGSHDVLALENTNGLPTNMYLSGNKLPVPKFVWKVFYSLHTQKGIAFVSVNNPFLKKIESNHYLCKDVCDNYGWGSEAWKNVAKGFVYCCEINDLRKTVKNIPEFEVLGVQEGNIAKDLLSELFANLQL